LLSSNAGKNPDGAFYLFPDVSYYFGKGWNEYHINDADDLCMFLLNHAHVSSVTGRAFGEPDCIRFSFANSMDNIEKAMKRITDALALLQ
jgi:aspartate aminotransferase